MRLLERALCKATRFTRSNLVLLEELIGYTNFYRNTQRTRFLSRAFRIISQVFHHSAFLRQAIAESTFESVMSLYELHSKDNALAECLLWLLAWYTDGSDVLLGSTRSDPHWRWKRVAVERILDAGIADNLPDALATRMTLPRDGLRLVPPACWLALVVYEHLRQEHRRQPSVSRHGALLVRLEQPIAEYYAWLSEE